MEPTYTAEAETYRRQIQEFLAEHLPSGFSGVGAMAEEEKADFDERWRALLAEHRMLAPAWPTEYGGGGLSAIEQVIIAEEFAKAGAPTGGANDGFGIGMVGPTILAVGSEEQKRHFLPRIISGEDRWCQGYSEPDAGSDLANLGASAVLDGDEWVINGQKVWTSQGHTADWIFVLCRTAPEEVKHRGITFLLCPMDQPGVEVRPIINISGRRDFNEIFFSDARTAVDNVVGEVNGGWSVANTLLGFERGGRATVMPLLYREELERLLDVAKTNGKDQDPLIRQRLMKAHSTVEILRFLGMRTLTERLAGGAPGPGASIFKLIWSGYHKEMTELALDIIGPAAMTPNGRRSERGIGVDSAGAPFSSQSWADVFYGARAGTIYAGTSEIQRNIVGERVLGLPKEPRADTGPWRESRAG